MNHFTPQDTLHLWCLAEPQSPRLVGSLHLVDRHRSVSLRYANSWLENGFALSEDLPLIKQELLPSEVNRAVGAVDDARPDRWGERIIRLFERPSRLSLLEYLFFAGDDRIGALGVSLSDISYQPHASHLIAEFTGLEEMDKVIRQILANEPVTELQKRLLRPGASLGGARPKSLVTIEGQQWIVKFSEGEIEDTPLIEHAAMTLAKLCGINVAETRALAVGNKHAIAIRRFDRIHSQRLHVLSANVALKAVGEELGYPELSQLLRRLTEPSQVKTQQLELFKRMVFNILIDNTDDHEKNHALIRDNRGYYYLSPAYDVVPSLQGLRYQQMRVGKFGNEATLENALSQAQQFGLTLQQASSIIKELCGVIQHWAQHFSMQGVLARDIDELSQYLEGDFLRQQRQEFTSN